MPLLHGHNLYLLIDSSNNEGTNSRVTGELGEKGWFVGRGRTNGAIKLAMAGT